MLRRFNYFCYKVLKLRRNVCFTHKLYVFTQFLDAFQKLASFNILDEKPCCHRWFPHPLQFGGEFQWFVLFSGGEKRSKTHWKIRMTEKNMLVEGMVFALFAFKSIHHNFFYFWRENPLAFRIFAICLCLSHTRIVALFFPSHCASTFFFVLHNGSVVRDFEVISTVICCTSSWLHFIWCVLHLTEY